MAFKECFCMQVDREQHMLQCWEHTSARRGAERTAARAVSLVPCMCMAPVRRSQAVSNRPAAAEPLLAIGNNTTISLGGLSSIP